MARIPGRDARRLPSGWSQSAGCRAGRRAANGPGRRPAVPPPADAAPRPAAAMSAARGRRYCGRLSRSASRTHWQATRRCRCAAQAAKAARNAAGQARAERQIAVDRAALLRQTGCRDGRPAPARQDHRPDGRRAAPWKSIMPMRAGPAVSAARAGCRRKSPGERSRTAPRRPAPALTSSACSMSQQMLSLLRLTT